MIQLISTNDDTEGADVAKTGTRKKAAPKEKGDHGGRREGSGKQAWFRGKSASASVPQYEGVRSSTSVRLTPRGWDILMSKCDALTKDAERAAKHDETAIPVSRADFIEALIRLHGKGITLRDVQRAAAMG